MTMSPLYPCGKPYSSGTHNETVINKLGPIFQTDCIFVVIAIDRWTFKLLSKIKNVVVVIINVVVVAIVAICRESTYFLQSSMEL